MLILISPLLKRLLAEQICIFLTSQLIIIKNLAKPPNPLPPAILTYPLPSPRASARSPNSSEHSERSTGAADLNLSLSIIPASYAALCTNILPLSRLAVGYSHLFILLFSMHAEYLCSTIGSLVLGANSPSIPLHSPKAHTLTT